MIKNRRVLYVDDDVNSLRAFERTIGRRFEVDTAIAPEAALERIHRKPFAVVVSDLRMPRMNGLDFLEAVKTSFPQCSRIMLTGHGDYDSALTALNQCDIFRFFSKPCSPEQLLSGIEAGIQRFRIMLTTAGAVGQPPLGHEPGSTDIIGRSGAIARLLDRISLIGPHYRTILIRGETGTGKELVANAIQRSSLVRGGPFVKINCAALPESLIEAELFGHVKGAFTGATHDRPGLFESANQGTVFLDEIGELPLQAQAKLLRVLQERETRRIGSSETKAVEFRLISATNRDLQELVRTGRFREDLYYRIAPLEICIPPLRERRDDIPLLVTHFLNRLQSIHGKTIEGITDQAMNLLCQYHWPGNIRELENTLSHSLLMARQRHVEAVDLPTHVCQTRESTAARSESGVMPLTHTAPVAAAEKLDEVIAAHVRGVLRSVDGRRNDAAARLGIGRTTLYRILRRTD